MFASSRSEGEHAKLQRSSPAVSDGEWSTSHTTATARRRRVRKTFTGCNKFAEHRSLTDGVSAF